MALPQFKQKGGYSNDLDGFVLPHSLRQFIIISLGGGGLIISFLLLFSFVRNIVVKRFVVVACDKWHGCYRRHRYNVFR